MAGAILLCGFMASGKSTVGKLLAGRLGRRFVDLDEAVAEAAGSASVAALFAREGEEAFRARERRALAAAAAGEAVVALGGGAICSVEALALVRAAGARLVLLEAAPAELLRRAGDLAARPLLARAADPAAEVARLLAERAPFYRGAELTVDTTGRTPAAVADELAARLRSDP